jgi:N-acetylmuramoyl-L-alanine amidase
MILNQYTAQNTLGIAGISNQLCSEAVQMGFLAPIAHKKVFSDDDSLVHLFLHPEAVQRIRKVADEAGEVIVSTCYRTLAQQYILKRNLTSLVANVGRSDHGSGKSIDATNWDEIEHVLSNNGFSQSYGDRDAVHWDCDNIPDNRSKTVLVFQKLWNRNNCNRLDEDGIVGSGVLMALGMTPVNGFVNSVRQRYLSFHDAGKDVGKVQFKLRDKGLLKGACDGLFGNQTLEAVIEHQIRMHLKPTGIVDTETYNALMFE